MQIDPGGWLDAGAWFIGKMNYVLDRSDFKEQIVKMIPKAKNIFKHKDQNNTINNTARAIWSKRYNQQYNQD